MNKANYFKAAFLFPALLASQISFSQNGHTKRTCKVGVYKTDDDFRSDHMIEGKKVGLSIHFTSAGTEYFLKLKIDDTIHTTIKYPGGSAFAYRDEDCSLYRFYKEDDFAKVLYNDGICLYSVRTHGKYHNTYYYFSKDMYSPILTLTKKNLISEYSNSASFVEKISSLKNDGQLIRRDKGNGKYNVINLFNDSVK